MPLGGGSSCWTKSFGLLFFVPGTKILEKDRLACENDISQIDQLVRTHGNTGLIRKFHEVVDHVENGIDRE